MLPIRTQTHFLTDIICILPEAHPTSRQPAAWLLWHSAQAGLGPTPPNQDTDLTECKEAD